MRDTEHNRSDRERNGPRDNSTSSRRRRECTPNRLDESNTFLGPNSFSRGQLDGARSQTSHSLQISELWLAAQSGSAVAKHALQRAAASTGDANLESLLFDTSDSQGGSTGYGNKLTTQLPSLQLSLSHPPRTAPKQFSGPMLGRLHGATRGRARPRTVSTAVSAKRRISPCKGSVKPRLSPGSTVQERVARAIAQKRHMERLAMLPENCLMNNYKTRRSRSIFECSDGAKLPYEILGEAALDIKCFSLVVVHDIFDTMDSTRLLCHRLVQRHSGCQVLVYNYAGQAGSFFPSTKEYTRGLDVITHARHLHELLRHVHISKNMLISTSPFLLTGIGFGFHICANLLKMYVADESGVEEDFRPKLGGLVSLNGFVRVDAQLAAALRAALAAFETFPADRPDLPVSYLSRFLFSDDYLERVHPRLALNIYTAVANPITMEGRLALIRGLLNGTHTKLPSKMCIPLVILQSTQDALVSPSQVDSLLTAHRVRHVWSHELDAKQGLSGATLGMRARALIRETMWSRRNVSPNLACVVWVKAGHEVRQEAARIVEGVFDAILPYAEFDNGDDNYIPEFGVDVPSTTIVHKHVDSTRSDAKLGSSLTASGDCRADPVSGKKICSTKEHQRDDQTITESQTNIKNLPSSCENDITNTHLENCTVSITDTVFLSLFMERMHAEDFTNTVRAALTNDFASVLTRLSGTRVAACNVQVESLFAGSNTINLKITGLSHEEAQHVGTTLQNKIGRPVLPLYWADHEVRCISSEKELHPPAERTSHIVEKSSSKRSGDDAVEIERRIDTSATAPSPMNETALAPATGSGASPTCEDGFLHLSGEANVTSTVDQRRLRRYVETVPSAHALIKAHQELDEEASDLQERETRDEASGHSQGVKSDVQTQLDLQKEKIANQRLQLHFSEMQLQAEVDETDDKLVSAGLAPEYVPRTGDSCPVSRPVPVEYTESVIPPSIRRQNDVFRALAASPLVKTKEPAATDDESSSVKREMESAQLLRESDILPAVCEYR